MIKPSQYKTALENALTQAIAAAANALGASPGLDLADSARGKILERPRDKQHGDLSCPLPLTLAKPLRQKPAAIAQQVHAALNLPDFISAITIAAPGFINFTIAATAKTQVIGEILTAAAYGIHPKQPHTLLVEFISANPTGPLHVGHGRACAYGDALSNILAAAGATVEREYYVNDAGRQMDILTASVWLRYWRHNQDKTADNSEHDDMPEGTYRGAYLQEAVTALTPHLQQTTAPTDTLAEALAQAASADATADTLVVAARRASGSADSYAELRRQLGHFMMNEIIKKDIASLNVNVQNINFFSETRLHSENTVEKTLARLAARDNHFYEKDGAVWFATTAYGDEKDRVIRRSGGEPTYFAADIAYHNDKLSRRRAPGHSYTIINVLGADHHGYVPRLSAAVQALGFPAARMETEIIQFVSLLENGQRLKMSTRAGEFITLRQLVATVGSNAARYYYLNRKNDQHLDFDIAAAKAQERNNPIYYLQYAYVRIHQVLEAWRENWGGDRAALAGVNCAVLADDSAAVDLCGSLMRYPEQVLAAAAERAPHLLVHYLHQVATELHTFYEQTRILPPAGGRPADGMEARLALLAAAATVLNNGAGLLGLHLPERM